MAAKVLASFGVTLDRVRKALNPISSPSSKPQKMSQKEPEVDDFLDGSRDATEFIQYNLDKAAESHGEVYLPAGRYRLDGT